MALLALPTELLSRICKVLGRHYNSDGDLEYHQTDFGALRLTCREVYEKTIYDASVRFGFRLAELEIELDQSSLAKSLLNSKTPYLRDRIVTLYLDRIQKMQSPDVVYLLAACLDNLRHAQKLSEIQVFSGESHLPILAVLTAMELSQFPRKLVHIYIDVEKLEASSTIPGLEVEHGYGQLVHYMSSHSPYIQSVALNMRQFPNSDTPACGQNLGSLSNIIASLKDVNYLTVIGCCYYPGLPLCQGCHSSIGSISSYGNFTQLTTLKIENMYISGERLGRFIESYADTLVDIGFWSSALTDSTWRSIAQRLLKSPRLSQVYFSYRLYQKKAQVLPMRLPTEIKSYKYREAVSTFEVTATSVEHVRRLLFAFTQYLHTTPPSQGGVQASHPGLPQYHKVCLGIPDDIPNEDRGPESHKEYLSYANEVDRGKAGYQLADSISCRLLFTIKMV
jgi:hypothetical protein